MMVRMVPTLRTITGAALILSACASSLPPGTHLRRTEATLETDGTVLESLDGRTTRLRSPVTILPGRHAIGLTLRDSKDAAFATITYYSRGPLVVCFDARAGRIYRARPLMAHRRWEPEIIDTTNQTVVRTVPCR
jgi:hypothetical protein